jgi:hypothetical protein
MSDIREVHHVITRAIVDEACARVGVPLTDMQRRIMAAYLRGERVYVGRRQGWGQQRVAAAIRELARKT